MTGRLMTSSGPLSSLGASMMNLRLPACSWMAFYQIHHHAYHAHQALLVESLCTPIKRVGNSSRACKEQIELVWAMSVAKLLFFMAMMCQACLVIHR